MRHRRPHDRVVASAEKQSLGYADRAVDWIVIRYAPADLGNRRRRPAEPLAAAPNAGFRAKGKVGLIPSHSRS
jgi:hypothetical protein